jgi:hypothetical protein
MEKVNIDGLSLHAAVGSLGVIEAQQKMPVSAMAIDPLIPNKRQIQIIWPMGLTETSEYAILIAWSLRNIYASPETPVSSADLVAGMISYLNCLLPPSMRLHTQASVQPGEVLMRTTLQPIRHQKV